MESDADYQRCSNAKLALPQGPFALMDIDNITLFNRIPTPCFGEADFWAKQRGNPDMDQLPAMQGFESFVEYGCTQEQRGIQLFARKGLAASLREPPNDDNFKVIQIT